MGPAEDLFETHLAVTDLNRAIEFYRDKLGLQVAHVTVARQAAFFWIGGRGNAMLGLWAAGPGASSAPPEAPGPRPITSHIALRASVADVIAAPLALRSVGIAPLDFDGQPTDEPVVLAWMPAVSVYFFDPDRNLLEYIAMLADPPQPELGVVPWGVWELRHRVGDTSSRS